MFDLELPTIDILQQVFFWVWLLLFNIGLLRFSVWRVISESESRSVVSDSLWPHGLYSLWNSPGQITGVGSFSFLQGVFPTQGSNPGLPHCRQILYQLSHQGSVHVISSSFLFIAEYYQMPQFVYLCSCWGIFGLFLLLDYCESNCHEPSSISLFFFFFLDTGTHFSWVYCICVCVCVCVCVCIIDTQRLG